MDKIINVGIAGFGMSGQIFQAPFLDADDRFCIRKVYERTTNISSHQYPYVEVVRSFEDLLSDDIDLVIISTPNALHFSMAKEAMEAGKAVIVEKPAAATAQEVERLMQTAEANGVLLSVYQNRRLDGDFLTVKKIVESGELGRIKDYECRYDRFECGRCSKEWKAAGGSGIGVLYDLGVHIIDQAVTLFGMPKEVYADLRREREESGSDDNFQVILYYPDKKVVLSSSELVLEKGPHYALHGTEGSFVKYGMDSQEDALIAGIRPRTPGFGEDGEEMYGILHTSKNGVESRKKIPTEKGFYGAYYDNIYEVMTQGGELFVKPSQARDVLGILEAAIRSNNEKRRVTPDF